MSGRSTHPKERIQDINKEKERKIKRQRQSSGKYYISGKNCSQHTEPNLNQMILLKNLKRMWILSKKFKKDIQEKKEIEEDQR